jgi:hypothetical protein
VRRLVVVVVVAFPARAVAAAAAAACVGEAIGQSNVLPVKQSSKEKRG